jgi:TPP-dependent pyruvate/acetoin dehydrogenase alpha subunit
MPKKKKSKSLKRLERAVVNQENVSEAEKEELDREVQEKPEETDEGLGIEKEEKEEAGLPTPSEEESLEDVEKDEED